MKANHLIPPSPPSPVQPEEQETVDVDVERLLMDKTYLPLKPLPSSDVPEDFARTRRRQEKQEKEESTASSTAMTLQEAPNDSTALKVENPSTLHESVWWYASSEAFNHFSHNPLIHLHLLGLFHRCSLPWVQLRP